jgi:hypothetical protein
MVTVYIPGDLLEFAAWRRIGTALRATEPLKKGFLASKRIIYSQLTRDHMLMR